MGRLGRTYGIKIGEVGLLDKGSMHLTDFNHSFFFFSSRQTYTWWASLVAQLVKNPPLMRETWV